MHDLHKICFFSKISIYTLLILSSCREEKDEKNDFDKKKEENQLVGEIIGNPAVQIAI